MKLDSLTIGTDPECMLFDRKENRIVSAIPVLKRGKEDKINLGNGYYCYFDNTMIEFNIPPTGSKKELIESLKTLFERVNKQLGNRYTFQFLASHTFTKQECEHEMAKMAGCDPEFCAYQVEMCYPPEFKSGFRSAGGHIHIGRKDYKIFFEDGALTEASEGQILVDPFNKLNIIRLMDVFVGTTLVLIDCDPTSQARRQLYGNAGRHRPTDYGVEYRTPGNYWLRSPKLVDLIYDLTAHVILIETDSRGEEIREAFGEISRTAIDTNNKEMAREIQKKLDIPNSCRERINEFSESEVKSDLNKEWIE